VLDFASLRGLARHVAAPVHALYEGVQLLYEGGGVKRASIVFATHIRDRRHRKFHAGNLGLSVVSGWIGHIANICIIHDITRIDIGFYGLYQVHGQLKKKKKKKKFQMVPQGTKT